MVRPAQLSDLPCLVEMGEKLLGASGYADRISPVERESLCVSLATLIETGVILVADVGGVVGMAAAALNPLYFNRHHLAAHELFWWVNEEHRGIGRQLFDALEAAVKARGADSLCMTLQEKLQPERLGKFYERNGYYLQERSYIKKL